MTDEELAARAIVGRVFVNADYELDGVDDASAAVVAALREAGRLVPEGCVAVTAQEGEHRCPA